MFFKSNEQKLFRCNVVHTPAGSLKKVNGLTLLAFKASSSCKVQVHIPLGLLCDVNNVVLVFYLVLFETEDKIVAATHDYYYRHYYYYHLPIVFLINRLSKSESGSLKYSI